MINEEMFRGGLVLMMDCLRREEGKIFRIFKEIHSPRVQSEFVMRIHVGDCNIYGG